jgi:hypothetical protein
MHDIALYFRKRDYLTENNETLHAFRGFVRTRVDSLYPSSFVDTGAPWSVVSSSVAQRINWSRLATKIYSQGKPTGLEWQGVPSEIGEITIRLIEPARGIVTRPLRLVAKFAKMQHPSLEGYVLLGLNFLAGNGIGLNMRGLGGELTGVLSVP